VFGGVKDWPSGGDTDNGYIGQKFRYSANIGPDDVHNAYNENITWSGAVESPPTGPVFDFQLFSTGSHEIKASIAIGGKTAEDEESLIVKDIFMWPDSGACLKNGSCEKGVKV
jgi:hypothetical protein